MSSRYINKDILLSEIFYGENYNSPQGSKIYDELKLDIPKDKKMVELGSGLGGSAQYFNTDRYIGIDLSEDMVKIASSRHNKKFICGDFLELDIPQCDVLFTREVFMYLTRDQAFNYANKIASLTSECVYFDLIKGDPNEQFDEYEKTRCWNTHTKNDIIKYFSEFDYEYVDISKYYAQYLSECIKKYNKKDAILKRAYGKLKYINDQSLKWVFIKFTKKQEI